MATPTPFHFKTPHGPRSFWRLMAVAAATRSGRQSSTATPGGDSGGGARRRRQRHYGGPSKPPVCSPSKQQVCITFLLYFELLRLLFLRFLECKWLL
ncbi:hypothetical protein HanRHA438_Chr16g0756831 [Helianthus annuus]|uniref:Uncharacterized protein n=1 Tax=Helianthus annuus TaxID=4232 RepID=A0A9K3DSR3_HELAN|nr:hypothetical protein HanXRQr2_Chr16g0745161 [Helianthus annuus]KAJ0820966.1 hypothetical protein HanPSC8_Chr16g0714431 [Helianthus annuus]KAJ0835567.1 hypothetical protein HanRHA438_Chr16g0756831 [Helianthus annuus]